MSNNSAITKQIIHSYWKDKDDWVTKASRHHEMMNQLYGEEIEDSIRRSQIYGTPLGVLEVGQPRQKFVPTDSISAFYDNYERSRKICILNFASYKNPGGGFMSGSSAQEESLCHESTLYEVISADRFKEYYEWNNEHKNRALYTDRAIYSPDIIVDREDNILKVDMLTCAAPNYSTAHRYQNITKEHNYKVLKNRMQFIANILEEQKVEIFIGGAFGCGVFGQDPNDLVNLYQTTIWGKHLEQIIHAVPGSGENVEVFRDAFGG